MLKKISAIAPQSVSFKDTLHIEWKDGIVYQYNYHRLRSCCPCAGCVDELTGKRIVQPTDIDRNVVPSKGEYVGNYALRIFWSDSHSTGIYTFRRLYENHPARIKSENIQ